MPPLAFAFLTQGRSMGIEKKGSLVLRAIAMGSNILLPLEKFLTIHLCALVKRKCLPEQFGGGLPCGADAIAFCTRIYLGMFPERMAAHADVKNAFGTIERSIILEELREEKSVALPYVSATFRSPGLSVIVGQDGEMETMQNRQGVVQGSPMSPALFCLGFNRALKETRRQHPDVLALAIADDVFLLGEPEQVIACLATLGEECEKDNLTLQPTKTEFYSPTAAVCDALQKEIDENRLEGRVSREGIVVAGIPVSRTRGFTEEFVDARIKETAELVMRCILLPAPVAMLIYRQCIQTKWEHLWRSGCLLGLELGGKLQKLERLEQVFTDYISSFESTIYEASNEELRDAFCVHQRKVPLAQGGVGLALIPSKLPRVARFAGMVCDVLPGLISLAQTYGLDFKDGLASLDEATPAAVAEKDPAYGMHSAPVLEVADWALRWTVDRMRRLVQADTEDPLLRQKYRVFTQPVRHADFPQFLKKVWDPERFATLLASPDGSRDMCKGV